MTLRNTKTGQRVTLRDVADMQALVSERYGSRFEVIGHKDTNRFIVESIRFRATPTDDGGFDERELCTVGILTLTDYELCSN